MNVFGFCCIWWCHGGGVLLGWWFSVMVVVFGCFDLGFCFGGGVTWWIGGVGFCSSPFLPCDLWFILVGGRIFYLRCLHWWLGVVAECGG